MGMLVCSSLCILVICPFLMVITLMTWLGSLSQSFTLKSYSLSLQLEKILWGDTLKLHKYSISHEIVNLLIFINGVLWFSVCLIG